MVGKARRFLISRYRFPGSGFQPVLLGKVKSRGPVAAMNGWVRRERIGELDSKRNKCVDGDDGA
jgi:hypothetical protein